MQMISPIGPFQNGTAHFKSGQPVLKPATDFKSGCNIYTLRTHQDIYTIISYCNTRKYQRHQQRQFFRYRRLHSVAYTLAPLKIFPKIVIFRETQEREVKRAFLDPRVMMESLATFLTSFLIIALMFSDIQGLLLIHYLYKIL